MNRIGVVIGLLCVVMALVVSGCNKPTDSKPVPASTIASPPPRPLTEKEKLLRDNGFTKDSEQPAKRDKPAEAQWSKDRVSFVINSYNVAVAVYVTFDEKDLPEDAKIYTLDCTDLLRNPSWPRPLIALADAIHKVSYTYLLAPRRCKTS